VRSDAALVKRSRNDPAAFRELYERYARPVYGFHLRRTREPEAAHDLTAETFAQAWLVRARFRDEAGGSAAPWLFGIARNVLLMSVRRRALEQRARERLGLLAEHATSAAEPEPAWLDGLDEALEELPPAQLEAMRLRFVDDLPYADVGDALGTSPGTARVRVHRALTTLRHRFADSQEAPR
jgi:RNA polymerase sigma-70 factor (ECF subfamily)